MTDLISFAGRIPVYSEYHYSPRVSSHVIEQQDKASRNLGPWPNYELSDLGACPKPVMTEPGMNQI